MQAMAKFSSSSSGTPLMVQSLAAAIAQAEMRPLVKIDLGGLPGGWYDDRKEAVADHVRATMQELESVIRATGTPPAAPSPAVLARRMVTDGENFEPRTGTYTPGPGFDAYIWALVLEAFTAAEQSTGNQER